jgi:hypothetical protein
MTLIEKTFDTITEADLVELLANGVPESLVLDYKQEPYEMVPEQNREFLKDISALANSAGGHLVIGLTESGGVPSGFLPITIDLDAEVRRLSQIAQSGLQPRLIGLQIRGILLAGGGYCLIIHVPKSWTGPHRVISQGSNRFYARRSNATFEMDIDELRAAFTLSSSSLERATRFRGERVARITSGDLMEPVFQDLGLAVLHLLPLTAFASTSSVDIDKAAQHDQYFRPLDGGSRPTFNAHGFIYGDLGNNAYAQIFRTGAIESVSSSVIDAPKNSFNEQGSRWINAEYLEQKVRDSTRSYLDGLSLLDVPYPMVLALTLLKVQGAKVRIDGGGFRNPQPIRNNDLDLPPVLLDEEVAPTSWRRALRPIFDALANASGMSRAANWDSSGNYIARR